jgi:hypothetical protein
MTKKRSSGGWGETLVFCFTKKFTLGNVALSSSQKNPANPFASNVRSADWRITRRAARILPTDLCTPVVTQDQPSGPPRGTRVFSKHGNSMHAATQHRSRDRSTRHIAVTKADPQISSASVIPSGDESKCSVKSCASSADGRLVVEKRARPPRIDVVDRFSHRRTKRCRWKFVTGQASCGDKSDRNPSAASPFSSPG